MSAETEIATLLTMATLAVDRLADDAESLVNEAVGVLDKPISWPLPPGSPTNETGVYLGRTIDEDEIPQSFPTWPTINLGTVPETQDLDEITLDDDEAPEFPTLSLPSFSYFSVTVPGAFADSVPNIDTSLNIPTPPDITLPTAPLWMPLRTLTTPTLSVDAPALAAVDVNFSFDPNLFNEAFDRFKTAIFSGTEGLPGLTELLAELTSWSDNALKALLPRLLEILQARFDNKYANILAFHDTLQARLASRLTDEQSRVLAALTDNSGWDRPQAAQLALRAMADQVIASWSAHATSQTSTRTAELVLQFFEFCGSLFASLQRGFLALKGKEIELVLEAHKWGLAYAKQALAAALAVYEATQFTVQGLMIQRGEAELAVAEAELKLALVRFTIAESQLQIQQAQRDQDGLLIQQYTYEQEAAQTAVTLYTEQVAAMRSELAVKKLPLMLFESQVKAFEATINAHEALTAARVAEIEGDTAKVEGELAKVKAYVAEAKAFENRIALQQQIVAGQADRNAALIEEYTAKIKAVLTPLEQEALANDYTLTKYEVLADDVLADAKLTLEQAKVNLEWVIKEQEGRDKAYEFTQRRALDLMEVELKRLEAIASVNAQGADLMANMAQGAMGVANGIANVIYKEEA